MRPQYQFFQYNYYYFYHYYYYCWFHLLLLLLLLSTLLHFSSPLKSWPEWTKSQLLSAWRHGKTARRHDSWMRCLLASGICCERNAEEDLPPQFKSCCHRWAKFTPLFIKHNVFLCNMIILLRFFRLVWTKYCESMYVFLYNITVVDFFSDSYEPEMWACVMIIVMLSGRLN